MSTPSTRRPCRQAMRLHLIGPLTLLGPPEAIPLPEVPRGRAATLLALLAARRNHVVGVGTIVDALWPEDAPPSAVRTVAALISRLRRLVGRCLERVGAGYRLDTTGWRVDVDEAAQLVTAAERHSAAEPVLADAAAQRALDLLTAGRAVEEIPSAPWIDDLDRDVDRLLRRARRVAWSSAAAIGAHRRAAEAASAALSADPYDEHACRALMAAQSASGSPGEALLTFDGLRRRLRTDLGADPGPRTAALHRAILAGRLPGAPVPDRVPATPPRCDPPALVGRRHELERLSAAWHNAVTGRPTTVLVQGAGGMGKSALLTELGQHAEQHGGTVLRVDCGGPAGGPGMSALAQAVAHHFGAHSHGVGEPTAGSKGPQPGSAQAIHGLLSAAADPGPNDPGALVGRGDAAASLLLRLADRRPLLLAVDDVHLADAGTVQTILGLGADVRNHRLLMLFALHELDVPVGLRPMTQNADRLSLGPLTGQAIVELTSRHGLSAEAAGCVQRLTAGHPALVARALELLRNGRHPANPEHLVDGLTGAALALVERLGGPVTDLLRFASLIGPRFRFEEALAGSGLPRWGAARLVERAVRSDLLQYEGETLAFAGEAVHAALCASVPAPLRAGLRPQRSAPPRAMAAVAPRRRLRTPGSRCGSLAPGCGCRPRSV